MILTLVCICIFWSSCFLVFDKKKFLSYLPTIYLGAALAFMSDILALIYPIWIYHAPNNTIRLLRNIMNEFGIYVPIIYLYLYTMTKYKEKFIVFAIWILISAIVEIIFLEIGDYSYRDWWSFIKSIIADLFLYSTFYFHHKLYGKLLHKFK